MFKHLTRLFTLLLLACAAPAQTAPSPNLAGLAHVALRVHDLPASIAFYEKLGFVKAFDLSRDGQVYEAFIKINDRQFIELYPTDAKNPQAGFLHLCFEGNDLQSVHDFYLTKGLTPNAVRTAGAGNLLFTMPGPLTPQGPQNMEYTQYMPGSLHSKDFGQHLGPDRIATSLRAVTIAADDPKAADEFYRTRLAFRPSTRRPGDFHIPGSTQRVILVPAATLEQRARITLNAPEGMTAKKLKSDVSARGLTSAKTPTGDVTLTDPDGNQINLHPARL